MNIRIFVLIISVYFQNGLCALWRNGVVHYAINHEHYDDNSRGLISSTLAAIEKALCLRFFEVDDGFDANNATRLLYISNPSRRQECPPDRYDYIKTIIEMPIGYKCMNKKSIARVVTDMLIASIEDTVPTFNSFDLIRKFQEQDDPAGLFIVNRKTRNFINTHYYSECSALSQKKGGEALRTQGAPSPCAGAGALCLSTDNEKYYKDKIWPLGIVMYGVDKKYQSTAQLDHLMKAMATIQLGSCIIFQEMDDDVLKPKNYIWFGDKGESVPNLGFKQGKQWVYLQAMVSGVPGHSAHTLALLLRALGVPMASNRPDRDNYININWNHIRKGEEHYLEKAPMCSWIRDARLPYDFYSATHAPANFACEDCGRGRSTVEPANDHLWQRTLSMGHTTELSEGDKAILTVLYSAQCQNRYANKLS